MQSNNDEVPIGGGSSQGGPQMIDEYATSAQDKVESSGSLEERLQSKNWSVRASAFDELNQLFKGAQSKHSDIFRDHSDMWKKYLSELNPGALEKCLDCLQSFIDFGDPKMVVVCQNDIIKLLIEKCINHAKPTIKQKGLENFNLLFEVTESFDDSIETMVECLAAKNIKVSQASQIALNSWLSNYGSKKVKIKPFLKQAELNAGSSNPQIRQEAMNFYKECYKSVGDGLKPLIQDLKKQQLEELDKAFEELKDKPKNIRLTRSEKEKMKDAKLDEIIKQEEEQKSSTSAAYDLADAVDLLSKYNPDWQEKILELKKWNEKKDLLDQFINDSNVPKIQNGDFSDLVKVLKKLVGDANQVVSQLAIKACGNLAKGLRKDFEPNCREIFPVLVQKFKEKKTQIIEEVHKALEGITECTNMEQLIQEIAASISDKAPTVKKNACTFLDKFAQITYIDVLQRCSGELIQPLMKSSDDQAGDVRDAALCSLGILKGRLGDAQMSKFLQELNPQKLSKVNESAQTVKPSKYDRPEKKEPPPKAVKGPPAKTDQKKAPAKKVVQQKQEEKKKEDDEELKISEIILQEQPVGGDKNNNNFDDMPIGQKNNSNNFDDMPIGGNKKQGSGFDEQPIGGGNKGYNLDDLDMQDQSAMTMNFGGDQPAKKRAVPPRFAQKKEQPPANEEKLDNEDAMVMSPAAKRQEETKKPPQNKPKPAPKETAKSTGTAAAGKSQAAAKGGAGGGQEEDLGAGLSKEEAEAKVNETFNPDIVSKMEESKWQDKVEGFKGIGEQIVELQPDQVVIEALAKYVKSKMKDWKESNINVVKECIGLFMVVAQNCEKVNRRAVAIIMPFLSDKLGDIKVLQSVSELIMALAELVTPKFIALQVVKHGSSAKNPKTLQESCNILTQMTDDFGAGQMPLKEIIDFGNNQINHQNPQVRTAAMALFAMMYKHVGETIKNFLKDIKESTMKLLEAEFAKVVPLKKGEHHSKRGLRGEAAAEVATDKKGGSGGGGLDSLPREDISKQINPKLIAMFKNNDWKVRKEAADKIEEMLKAANMRIQPTGLNELMDNIKQRMVDPNKAVLKSYVQLLAIVVEALGPQAKQFSKKVLGPMLQNLADKQSLVRNDVLLAADKWAEQTGAENVINYIGPLLIQDNPELRTEALQWMGKNKESIKICDTKELVKPLMQCVIDRIPLIRGMAETMIFDVMSCTGYGPFKAVIDDMKPAVQNQVKPILEKVKQKVGANVVSQPQQSDSNMNSSLGQKQGSNNNNNSLKEEKKEVNQGNNNNMRASQGANSNKPTLKGSSTTTNKDDNGNQMKVSSFGEAAKKTVQQKQAQPQISGTVNSGSIQSTPGHQSNKNVIGGRSESKEPQLRTTLKQSQHQQQNLKESVNNNEENVLHIPSGLREKRMDFDRKNKWIQEELKSDQIDKLKSWASSCLGQNVSTKMFSNDFKQHTECIELFLFFNQSQPDQFKEILDIVFKWSLIKMGDSSNTQFAVKLFDFLSVVFQDFADTNYMILDFEAQVIFPLLCDKTGINNVILKEKVKRLLRMIYNIYDKQKCYQMLIQYGLNSKNMKTAAECLDELAEFIKQNGVDYSGEKDIKLVAKMADSSDKGIRENALKVLSEVHAHIDQDIWRVIGEVTPKVLGLLEQRLNKKPKGGLTSSSSQSNFFQPNSNIGSQNNDANERGASPRNDKNNKTQTGGSSGLKKQLSNVNQNNMESKKAITPRNNLTFNKIGQKQNNEQQSFSQNSNLSRSINQYNQPQQEEQKKIPSGIPKKSDHLRKTVTSDEYQNLPSSQSSQSSATQSKRLIPQSQRQDSSSSGLQNFARRGSDADAGQISSTLKQQSQEPTRMTFQTNNKDNMLAGSKQQNMMQKSMYAGTKGFLSQDEAEFDNNNVLIGDEGHELEQEQQEVEVFDQEFQKQQDEIVRHIHQLKYGDLSKRVDSLVSLNELISQIENNKQALVKSANELANAFTHVLMDIFDRPLDEIPLRFAKYFITIVLKACSCKEIMREVSEEKIFELAEQLLTRLLIENLDKVGENKEGELILKNLNSSMLRLLENCNHTYIFCVLFNLLRKYKDFHQLPKLPGLIIKCLLKLSKILEKLIEKLEMDKILLAIHEYLVVINHENKTQNDEMGIRIVKTVINELVKLKRENIMEAYKVIQEHQQQDNHIYRWIQIILKSLQSSNQSASMSNSGGQTSTASNNNNNSNSIQSSEAEIKQIVDELRNSEQFESAIPKLYEFLESHPDVDLNEYLQDCSKTFSQFIRSNLEKYRNQQQKEEQKQETEQLGMMDSMKSTNISDGSRGNQNNINNNNNNNDDISGSNSNKISAYQNKIIGFKQRFQQKQGGADTGTNKEQAASSHNLNTSFSAMNTSLSQKWQELNKKSAATKREGAVGTSQSNQQQHMSNTMGGFGGGSANTLVQRQNSNNMNQSSGGGSGGQGNNEADGQNTQGATNQDLNRRLAEMKAKLQALKKKNN